MISSIVFYMFAFITLFSAMMVVTARHPVHSVLFLVLAFFNAAALFILLGAEFIAMILVIVYVGAVAVLFLFVVMMLDLGLKSLREEAMRYLPVGLFAGGVLLVELVTVFSLWRFAERSGENIAVPVKEGTDISNTEALGHVLYTDYLYPFQVSGLILLVAMVGAIVLTHRRRVGVRKQSVSAQQARTRDDSVEVQKITPGTGV